MNAATGKAKEQASPSGAMIEALDEVRRLVHGLGWIDEGSVEQAGAILDGSRKWAALVNAATAVVHNRPVG